MKHVIQSNLAKICFVVVSLIISVTSTELHQTENEFIVKKSFAFLLRDVGLFAFYNIDSG